MKVYTYEHLLVTQIHTHDYFLENVSSNDSFSVFVSLTKTEKSPLRTTVVGNN